MDFEVLAKVATIAFGAITAGIAIEALLKARKSRLREDYRFAKEFIADLGGPALSSRFLKQRGCHALTGNASVEFRTLELLWSLENPSQAINDYSLGSRYLEHRRTTSDERPLQFLKPYDRKWWRRFATGGYLALYAVMYSLACSPILLHVFGWWGETSPIPALIVTCAIFLPFSFIALKARFRIQRAEYLVEHARDTGEGRSTRKN